MLVDDLLFLYDDWHRSVMVDMGAVYVTVIGTTHQQCSGGMSALPFRLPVTTDELPVAVEASRDKLFHHLVGVARGHQVIRVISNAHQVVFVMCKGGSRSENQSSRQ